MYNTHIVYIINMILLHTNCYLWTVNIYDIYKKNYGKLKKCMSIYNSIIF